jgi:hypothetical protein
LPERGREKVEYDGCIKTLSTDVNVMAQSRKEYILFFIF